MAYVAPEDIAQARSMDLLTYLKNYEPGELVKVANGTYCTREHDSLKISNGMWYWFSRSIGGASALDYLIRVKGYSLPVAVETILGRAVSKPPVSYKQKDRTPKQLLLPERNCTNANVTRYLRSRGIHPAILDYCYRNELLYEGLPYRNAVFIGYDENRTPKYAALRGTVGNYKGEASGSDKQYSFNIPAMNLFHWLAAGVELFADEYIYNIFSAYGIEAVVGNLDKNTFALAVVAQIGNYGKSKQGVAYCRYCKKDFKNLL